MDTNGNFVLSLTGAGRLGRSKNTARGELRISGAADTNSSATGGIRTL